MWEVNPLLRWFYHYNLVGVWFVISVVASVVTFAIFGSLHATADEEDRPTVATVYSAVWTIRLTASLYGAGTSFMFLEDPRFLLLVAIPVFLGVRLLLRYETRLTWAGLVSWLHRVREDFSDSRLGLRWTDEPQPVAPRNTLKLDGAPPSPIPLANSNRRKAKVVVAAILLVAIPFLIVPFILQLLLVVMMANIPYEWMRNIGIVSPIQGQIFLASLALIVLAVGLSVYLILAIFKNLQPPEL
jgi:hypothetical protein